MDGDSQKRGRWVFRNQRWFFMPGDADLFESEPAVVDRYSLAALADIAHLLEPLQAGMAVFSLPVQMFFIDRTEEGKNRGAEASAIGPPAAGELICPPWCQSAKSVAAELEHKLANEMRHAAHLAITDFRTVEMDGPFGPNSIIAVPIGFSHDDRPILFGAAAGLIADRETVAAHDDRWLASASGKPFDGAAAAREILLAGLPSHETADAFRKILRLYVEAYSTRVQEAYSYRIAIAAEQARSRHYLLRAEGLERRLLSGTTEVRRAQSDSGVAARQLEAILDNPAVGITIEDTDHVVRYLNPVLRQTFGNVVGRKCYRALKGRTEPCENCPIEQLWREGKDSVRYTTLDERTGKHFEVTSFPLVGDGGEKLVVEVGIDITRLMKKQQGLRDRVEAATQRNRQVLDLLRQVVELLLELSGQVGDVLVQRMMFGETQDTATEWLRSEATSDRAERISQVFEQLSATVKSAGQVAVALASGQPATDVDVGILGQSLAEELSAELPDRSVKLRVSVMPALRCDRGGLANIVRCLMQALAHTGPGGPLELRLSHTMSALSEKLSPGDDYHVLSLVRAGVEPDAPETRERPADGTEVEFQVADMLTKRLGGELWKSGEDEGNTTYYFTVPIKPVA